MSKFFFRHSHSFRRENHFSLGIPLRVLAYTSTIGLVSQYSFRLFFGCFTAKHFISYHWKAIRRYSIWRSEGLATSYIDEKLGYRMITISWDLRKNNENKKKFGPRRHTFPTTLTSQVIYSYLETKYFEKSRIVTFRAHFETWIVRKLHMCYHSVMARWKRIWMLSNTA